MRNTLHPQNSTFPTKIDASEGMLRGGGGNPDSSFCRCTFNFFF